MGITMSTLIEVLLTIPLRVSISCQKTEKAYGRLMQEGRCEVLPVPCAQTLCGFTNGKQNIPIGSIRRILGHSSRVTTEIYLHQIAQADRHAVKVLEQSDSGDFLTHESHTGGESSMTRSP